MNNIEQSILNNYLERFPAYNDKTRYNICVTQTFKLSSVPTLIRCLKKNKFSGKTSKFTNVGDIKMWNIQVFDKTLPEPASSRSIDGMEVRFGDIEKSLDCKEVLEMLEELNKNSQAEQLRRSVTETTAERTFSNTFNGESNVRPITVNIPLSLPTTEGVYSAADKEFFSWWAKDSGGNLYLRLKDGSLMMATLKEGSSDKIIRNDPDFWSAFWKSYRDRIIELSDQVIKYAWSLKDSIEDADLDESRLRMKIDPNEKRSIITMIHQFLPKCWMSRLCLTLNIDQVDEYNEEGKKVGTEKYFKGFTLGFFPDGYVTSNPQPPTDENWVKMLSYAAPNLARDELAMAKRFSNNPGDLAINIFQKGAFIPKDDNIPDLPPMWNKFFENRLGGNFSSQMYRIAKWVIGVLDDQNFGRRVLVVAGHGADGKSIFQNVLLKGFNNLLNSSNFAKILPVGAIDPTNTQNGLLPCMDSRVLFTADVTKVTEYLKSEVVKNITGCDEVTAQVKYSQPVTKSMAGVKLMVTTNNVTYLSDTFVDSRVSPIYFERADRTEADWDAYAVKAKMLEEFPDFVRWCFAFAYAQDNALGAPIHGDPKVWSDTAEGGDERAQWEALGSEKGGDPMFKYRKMDANAEILEEDIMYKLNDLFYATGNNDKLPVGQIREVISNCLNIKFRDAGADKRWNLVSKLIQRVFNVEPPKVSHGIRYFFGVGVKNLPDTTRDPRESRRQPRVSTELPYGL